MERDEQSGGDAYVEARVPAALYDRVEALFRDHRGYDSTSVQESLSLVCDLAERQIEETDGEGGSDFSFDGEPRPPSDRPTQSEAASPGPQTDESGSASEADASSSAADADVTGIDARSAQLRDAIDDVFPTDWDASERTERVLPTVVGRYVVESDAETRSERENAALSAVAAREGTTPESLRETLVEEVYGGSAMPGDLASEFFSEAMEKVERRVDDLDPAALSVDRVDDANAATDSPDAGLDLGPGSGDLPPGLADEMASDGGAVQSVDERVDNLFTGPNGLTEIGLDSMIAGASTDCEICGETRSVESLKTTTEASDDRRVNLVCPDCL